MTGKDRTLTALSIQKPDRVPLYIHGINEVPIIGIGRHLTDGLPETLCHGSPFDLAAVLFQSA